VPVDDRTGPVDQWFGRHLDEWKALRPEWDVTALIAPDQKTVVFLACQGGTVTDDPEREPIVQKALETADKVQARIEASLAEARRIEARWAERIKKLGQEKTE
jgi:hypothetical protein